MTTITPKQSQSSQNSQQNKPTQAEKQRQVKPEVLARLQPQPKLLTLSLIALLIVAALGVYFAWSHFAAKPTIDPNASRFFRSSSPLIPSLTPLTSPTVEKVDLTPHDLQPQTHTFKPLSATPETTQISLKNGSYITSALSTDEPITRPVREPKEGLVPTRVNLTPLVITSYPHDSSCFTQGYAFHNGELFESCGLYQQSRLRTVDYTTGLPLRKTPTSSNIPASVFAEGLVIGRATIDSVDRDVLYLLTWKEQTVMRYSPATLERITPDFPISTEGWGITLDPLNNQLVVSDGSSTLFWYDVHTMDLVRRLLIQEWSTTKNAFVPIRAINELEWVGNEIWANVWYSDDIICINPNTGQVVRRLNGSTIRSVKKSGEDVINGIAFGQNGAGETKLLLTGKKWTQTFELDYTQVVIPYDPAHNNGATPPANAESNDDDENDEKDGEGAAQAQPNCAARF